MNKPCDDQDFQIHYGRLPNSWFVNNYFWDWLMAWEANMDIQPVFNQCKAVAFMCVYLSRSEDECCLFCNPGSERCIWKRVGQPWTDKICGKCIFE